MQDTKCFQNNEVAFCLARRKTNLFILGLGWVIFSGLDRSLFLLGKSS
jgi:hypothetical protein